MSFKNVARMLQAAGLKERKFSANILLCARPQQKRKKKRLRPTLWCSKNFPILIFQKEVANGYALK